MNMTVPDSVDREKKKLTFVLFDNYNLRNNLIVTRLHIAM